MAFHRSPKVHPWTPSRSRESSSRRPLTREEAKALDDARAWERRFDGMPASLRQGAEFWDFLVLSPILFGLLLAQRGVRALVRRVLRASSRKETAPSPSLQGAPAKEDVDSVWAEAPRTMLSALRLGSRLLDLEPTVDSSRVWKENPVTGKREVVFRHAGIKGWLQRNCPSVPYTTAMRYKKLASRLRTICGIAGNIPLEWLLPDAAIPEEGLDANTLAAIEKGRRELGKILAEAKSLRGLDRVVERRMDIARLPGESKGFSVISHKEVAAKGKQGGEMENKGENAGKGRANRVQRGENAGKWNALQGEAGEDARCRRGTKGEPPDRKRPTVAEAEATARRERLLAALRQAGLRPEGRLLWLHFRHLLARAAGDDPARIPRGKGALPMFGKNA